ncbi:unnamed protein product [marine sediment metagenome]|uniref:Coenzyme Q-binding protein COQ10 START domain-containing protein n=1 Tax=marine sediment metagenome TaxID=412755 RepID=X0SPD2_9ZZZZ
MTIIKRSSLVPYTPAQMYDLVNAVEDYAQFLPHCQSSAVLSRDADEVRASMVLTGMGMQKSFTTLNRLQKNKMIEIRLIDGPLKRLEGFWLFEAKDNQQCQVSLDLEFELGGGLLDFAIGPIFNQLACGLVDTFRDRAIDVYG